MYISVRYAPARRVANRAMKSATPHPRAAASPSKIPKRYLHKSFIAAATGRANATDLLRAIV